jgi:hypothetical protein
MEKLAEMQALINKRNSNERLNKGNNKQDKKRHESPDVGYFTTTTE